MKVGTGTTRQRPRPVALVAVWLAVSGAYGAVYSGFLPAFPPVAPQPWPPFHLVLGAACVIAAIGMWRLSERGRALALVCLCVEALYAVGRWSYRALPDVVPAELAWLIVEIAFFGALIWALLRRWPASRRQGRGRRPGHAAGLR